MKNCLPCFGGLKQRSNGTNQIDENIELRENVPTVSHEKRAFRFFPELNSDGKDPTSLKRFSFLRQIGRQKSTACSATPTYDYIDAINDRKYSKTGENPANSHRYDHPSFGTFSQPQPSACNEPFYTSASQIYYVASDDPYSSIVSDAWRQNAANYELESTGSGFYELGYERVAPNDRRPLSARPATTSSTSHALGQVSPTINGIDALYAKIRRRPNILDVKQVNGDLANSMQDFQPSTSTMRQQVGNDSLLQLPLQDEESGSGSVGSSSQNPSYRYLTVREPVDIIRERIRRQELLNNNERGAEDDAYSLQAQHREHYYSTIANEYESVGDERSLVNGAMPQVVNEAPMPSSSLSQPRRPQCVFRLFSASSTITLPFSLLTGRFHNHRSPGNNANSIAVESGDLAADDRRPKPPISPIPNRSLEELASSSAGSRPAILSPTVPMASSNVGQLDASPANGRSSLLNHSNIPSLSAIVSYNEAAGTSGVNSNNQQQQRFSYSFDPRPPAAGFVVSRPHVELTHNNIEVNSLRRNRVSAPASHTPKSFSATPPPLPPLPTPHGYGAQHQHHVLYALNRTSEMSENEISNNLR